ncbi:MAG: AbrB/MazE/SpoVT family DNA-binding domain-containing protein [Epsilonproteobacteria bacterium]|nr:MAG: AbrB/MazE/SpoVT family DNA-binding domain-containing protein [Campylobacterota bacterium]RLA64427.1 MAG: AbrB/MazE/SpoVT family DNA-binding domain-containing protein [Campylobacterota bacterium]
MIKKLTKHGNSMALILDRALLEILKIGESTPLEITTDGKSLTISPVHDEKRARKLSKSLEKVNKKYGKALKKMA